ncbi:MAG: hypothetical protein HFE59_08125 [Clostridiales bacterium]|nr:hypothetical protein [Clostridiales bacterium]
MKMLINLKIKTDKTSIISLWPCRLPYSPKGGGDTFDYRGFMINLTYIMGGDNL